MLRLRLVFAGTLCSAACCYEEDQARKVRHWRYVTFPEFFLWFCAFLETGSIFIFAAIKTEGGFVGRPPSWRYSRYSAIIRVTDIFYLSKPWTMSSVWSFCSEMCFNLWLASLWDQSKFQKLDHSQGPEECHSNASQWPSLLFKNILQKWNPFLTDIPFIFRVNKSDTQSACS